MRIPALGRLQLITVRPRSARTPGGRSAERVEEQADLGIERAPPETIALIVRRARLNLRRRVSDRMPSIGRSQGRNLPPMRAAPIESARGQILRQAPASRPTEGGAIWSISNSRGTTTMMVGRTSSMLAASFFQAFGI